MWIIKAIIQNILSILPGGLKINYWFQVLNGSYNEEKIKKNIINNTIRKIIVIEKFKRIENCTVLELGTGWSMVGSILLFLLGAQKIYALDHIPHARYHIIKKFLNVLRDNKNQICSLINASEELFEMRFKKIESAKNLDEFLYSCNIIYLAPYNINFLEIEEGTIDIFVSFQVFEHIPYSLVERLIFGLNNVMKKGSIAFHEIVPGDHSAGVSSVNFLKYPNWLWNLLSNKINYHNRMRVKQYTDIIVNNGNEILHLSKEIDHIALKELLKMHIDKQFKSFSQDELVVRAFDICYKY